jgi:hypothetical protein
MRNLNFLAKWLCIQVLPSYGSWHCVVRQKFWRKQMPWLSSLFLHTYEFFSLRFSITVYQASRCHIPQTTIFAGKALSSIFTAMRLSCILDISAMDSITQLTHISSRYATTASFLIILFLHYYIRHSLSRLLRIPGLPENQPLFEYREQ